MQSRIRTIALLSSLAFIGTIALAQSAVMSKETGPAASGNFSKYWSDSISNGYELINISFWPGGTPNNHTMNLRYTSTLMICFVSDAFCLNGTEAFEGPIPVNSVTFSGRPEWNGSFQSSLDVDTSVIDNSSTVLKEGFGGRIQFTCTQDPAQDVTSWSGQQTVQGLSGRTKQTGSGVFIPGNGTSQIGLRWFDGAEFSSSCGMNWFKLTSLNH